MNEQTYYAVKINGVIVSTPYTNTFAAEQHKNNLNESQQQVAQIVPVTETGQEILLG